MGQRTAYVPICDKCGKDMPEDKEKWVYLTRKYTSVSHHNGDYYEDSTTKVICDGCALAFLPAVMRG